MPVAAGSPSASAARPSSARGEHGPPLGAVELRGEPVDGDVVERQLAVRVAAGGEDEHCAPSRRLQLRLVDRHVAEHEPHEHGRELLLRQRGRLELL